jgi:2-iminobutanoate/2-iminopropanoate deaminase
VVCGDWLFCTGELGIDPASGELVPGGTVAQTRQVLANLAAICTAGGVQLSDAVKLTLLLANADDYAPVNAMLKEVFTSAPPARTTAFVSGLPAGAAVEIDLIVPIRR